MIIVTTNDVPGARITRTIGECFGLTVRSRHVGSNLGAGLKSLAGGELKGITKLLHEAREEALARLSEEAEKRGANAVVAFRFETNEYESSGVEVCAYGTAVVVEAV
ncbi:YbjQ family protein [Tomitella cavernea]|nr:YbjQ family protein [Tomitella cavernea]